MQNLFWKIVLILVVLALCLWSVYPPEQKVRLGKDLQGGVSLIYHVNIPAGMDKQAVLTQTIEVLMGRVNPQGILDISMQPLGADRIEIVMPLPNDRVLGLRKQYDAALKELMSLAQIDTAELDEALRLNQAVEKLGGPAGSERNLQMTDLQAAYDKAQAAKKALDDAKAAGAAGPDINTLAQAFADVQYAFDVLRESVSQSSVDQSRVVRSLALSKKPQVKMDPATNKPVLDEKGNEVILDSPREAALSSLKTEFPHLTTHLEETVAAFDAYQAKRTSLDDPEDLVRLLHGAGVLEFHIAVQDRSPEVNIQNMREQLKQVGPQNTEGAARWFPINELKQWYDKPEQLANLEANPEGFFAGRNLVAARHEGQYYLLLYTTKAKSMTHEGESPWSIERTGITNDDLGRPAVSFRLDASGGAMMSRLTGPHVQQPMAIVLDGQVYSAPTLQSAIGNSGIITGQFSRTELDYLTRVLAAGSLSARLSEQPIAINTVGPTIGKDNLWRGLQACLWSVIAVAIFMMVYYFQAGLVANIAVAANAVFIFGIMAMIQGTFTLPGLAGIALTIGTAVDANILIYERIREELASGEVDLRGAIRLGYDKALSAIIDSNLTNAVVCVALLLTATTEVKGFALTLLIGIIGTLFAALFMTKVIYAVATDYFGMKHMPMLATTVPVVHRFLSPHLDWIGLRKVFIPASLTLVLASWVLIGIRGNGIFDTEFRGGLSITMRTAKDADAKPVMLKQVDVERRVQEIGRKADGLPPSDQREVLREMRNADVLTVGEDAKPGADGLLAATTFRVKVALPPGVGETATFKDTIVRAIVDEFGPQLDAQRALEFAGAGAEQHSQYTHPITAATLGEVIGRPQFTQNVNTFRGGVVVVIDQIKPPAVTQDVLERLSHMRAQPDFSDTNGRSMKVFGLDLADPGDPAKGFSSMAIVVADPAVNFTKVDFETWDSRLARREWQMASAALARPATLEQISEFSSAVASTMRANAVVAVALSLLGILVYIWIRFGSLRYSAGAVIALVHDCSIGVGALALSQLIGETAFGKALLIDPFQIDMGVVAAVLTLIGYSLNDTIVVLDRIRENRGKLQIPTAETVNKSINQTFSRTTLTSLTMIISLLIMYVEGGTGIRAFSFVMLVGMIVGTYSSIAIAAPLVFKGHDESGGGTGMKRKAVLEPPKSRKALPAPA